MSITNQIRIIGGKWRSRKLCFPDLPELRPTPNRVRETLFNWLSPYIVGTHCLDLFAGSGALGFEALSRGAHSVVMVDQSATVTQQLQANAILLGAEKEVTFYCNKVPDHHFLLREKPFDIVFLDPPFHKNYLSTCAQWLEKAVSLAPNAFIYIEVESHLPLPLPIPSNWTVLKQKKTGQVGYYLTRIKKES